MCSQFLPILRVTVIYRGVKMDRGDRKATAVVTSVAGTSVYQWCNSLGAGLAIVDTLMPNLNSVASSLRKILKEG